MHFDGWNLGLPLNSASTSKKVFTPVNEGSCGPYPIWCMHESTRVHRFFCRARPLGPYSISQQWKTYSAGLHKIHGEELRSYHTINALTNQFTTNRYLKHFQGTYTMSQLFKASWKIMVRIGQDMLPSCLHPALHLHQDEIEWEMEGGWRRWERGISAFVKVAFRASSSAIATNSGRVEERRRRWRRMPCTPATYLHSQVHGDPELPLGLW